MVHFSNNSNTLDEAESKTFNLFKEEITPKINILSDITDSIYATIKGVVKDSFGNPLSGALVKIMSLTYEPIMHDVTDSNGQYKLINVSANIYKIYATYPNKILQEGSVLTVAPSQEIEKNFTLEDDPSMKLSLIAGDVIDLSTKKPIEKALTSLYSVNGDKEILVGRTATNKQGQFTFRDVKLGNYSITISSLGYNSDSVSVVTSKEGQILLIKVSLPKNTNNSGTVSGIIKDEKQNPIDRADVILYKVEENNKLTPVAFTKTNNEGVYLFENVPQGEYKIKSNENTVTTIVTPNSPLYYGFTVANASAIIPTIISVEDEANLYQGASYMFNNSFIKNLGGITNGFMTLNINAPFSGFYDVGIKYLSGFFDTTIILKEDPDNDGEELTLNFPKTNTWSLVDAKSINIRMPLDSGINEFKLFNRLGIQSPWIGDCSISYVKHSYKAKATDGTVANGAISLPPFVTGLGGPTNGEVNIPIYVPFSQPYKLGIQYLSGDASRTLKLDVDGENKANISVSKTTDWSLLSAKVHEINIDLEEGDYYFKFYNDTGEYSPNIGNLTFDEYTINKTFLPEDVILLEGATLKTDITGDKYIDGIVQGKGKVQFSINIFETQLYDFEISYKCQDERTCTIKINDEVVTGSEFRFLPTKNSIGVFNSQLFLTKGTNIITIYNE